MGALAATLNERPNAEDVQVGESITWQEIIIVQLRVLLIHVMTDLYAYVSCLLFTKTQLEMIGFDPVHNYPLLGSHIPSWRAN